MTLSACPQMQVLWAPTFTYWERLKCFCMAPVSIFMLNSIIYVTVCTPKSFGLILPSAALSSQL